MTGTLEAASKVSSFVRLDTSWPLRWARIEARKTASGAAIIRIVRGVEAGLVVRVSMKLRGFDEGLIVWWCWQWIGIVRCGVVRYDAVR